MKMIIIQNIDFFLCRPLVRALNDKKNIDDC